MLKWIPKETDNKDEAAELLVDANDPDKGAYGGIMTVEGKVRWTNTFPKEAPAEGTCESVEEAKMEVERKMMCYPLETGKPAIGRYKDEPHGFGETISVRRFRKRVKDGDFTDDDGHGRPMCSGKLDTECTIWPSTLASIPEDATHIQWYNK